MKSVWVLVERTIHQLKVANSNIFDSIFVVFFMAKKDNKNRSVRFSGGKMQTISGSFSGKYIGSKGSRCKYVDNIASHFQSFGKVSCLFVCLLDTGVLRECCLDDTEDCTLFR